MKYKLIKIKHKKSINKANYIIIQIKLTKIITKKNILNYKKLIKAQIKIIFCLIKKIFIIKI